MTPEQRASIERMIKLDDRYCERMSGEHQAILASFDRESDEWLLAKKAICDGMAESKSKISMELARICASS